MTTAFALKLPMYAQPVDTPFQRYIEIAQLAESAGFSSLYSIDHLVLPTKRIEGKTRSDLSRPYFLDPWTTLAAVAATTSRIRLGTQVTPVGRFHPIFLAKMGANIDRISNGRFTLGAGIGHQRTEYVSHGLPFPPFEERRQRMIEGLEIVRRLWADPDPVTYEGTFFSVQGVSFWPKPIQERVPIWFGGSSPSIQEAVVRLGDGWAPAAPQLGGFGPEGASVYRETLTSIRASAAAAGRTDHIGAGALFLTTISENPDQIEEAANLLRAKSEYAGASIADINDRGAVIMGDPDEISRRVEPYIEAGVEELTVSFHPLDDHDGIRRGIELYATKVLPRFA